MIKFLATLRTKSFMLLIYVQLNGVFERKNKFILDMIWCLINNKKIHKESYACKVVDYRVHLWDPYSDKSVWDKML